MADETKEGLMQPGFNPGYSAAYGPPPSMMAPPPTAPPQSYGAPGSYIPPPVAPPPAYNPYQQQAYNATYGQPGVPVQPPVQPVQPTTIQVTQQVSERQAATGFRAAPRSPFDICGCRNAWRRQNGFILAGVLIVLGLGSLIFGAFHQRSRYNETKDYEEGTCKNYHINRVNDTSHFQCERPACSGKRCKHSYACNAVIGRVHYSGGNRSELVQIYATYDESETYTGACSYKPAEDCKYSTESYFKSRGAFEGKEYLCFYSTSIPLKVLLEKNEDVGTSAFIVPCVILVVGIALLVAVKFFGHKFNCPSQSQLLQQQQEQHQLQQQQQLQALNQPQTA